MLQKSNKTNHHIYFLFTVGVFLFFMVFYCNVHPIVLLDADDWTYISCSRAAIPSTKFFNPCRILPEVLMPLCGNLAAYLIYPFTHHYMRSVSVMCALFVSAFTALYIRSFLYLLQKKFSLSVFANCFLALIFLALHFMAYRTQMEYNYHLFYSYSVTGYFYYNIPILLNSSLVMYFMGSNVLESFLSRNNLGQKAILVCAVYFAVFSNLFGSIILFGYAGVIVLQKLICVIRKKESFVTFLKNAGGHLVIGTVWFASALLELSGDRAGAVEFESSLMARVQQVFQMLMRSVLSMNKPMLLFCTGIAAVAVILWMIDKKQRAHESSASTLACCAGAVTALLVVLCAASVPHYIGRTYVLLAIWSLVLASVLCSFAKILQRFERVSIALPLLFCILISLTNTYSRTFVDNNVLYLSGDKCVAVGEELVRQIKTAAEAGEPEITLHVVDASHGEGDNWPHTLYMGDRIAYTLFKHGVVDHYMQIIIEPDQEINDRYGIGWLGE